MATAAVPAYLGHDFRDCPPGHRFGLYGAFWSSPGWSLEKSKASDMVAQFGSFPDSAEKLGDALRARQSALAEGADVAVFAARSTAPFVTGTGIEHPLENGFAFLNPYGMPYLPGASVKGVVRRAAQELAGVIEGVQWGTETAWTNENEAVEALFGKEPPPGSEEVARGALTFWDVYPACKGLRVEIMNPHHGEYYLGKSTPHDAGSPITIFFLTVPEGSTFSFHVQCDPRRIPEGLDWRSLLAEAFRHAFDWCGFGAKTAVGYGAMKRDLLAEERMEEERRQAHLAAMSEEERQLASLRKTLETELENGTLSANSRVASDRVNLLRAALEWESEDLRCQAADVIEETVHHLPWSKKAKPERREQTARLRQPK